MSQQNVEIVEQVLERARHDPDALFEALDDEVRWEVGGLDIPDVESAHWRGPAGVREFFRRWIGPFDAWDYEVVEVIDAGDSVVAQIHQWGRGKGSGVTVESRFWQVWTIRDRKIVRGTHHTEKADALEAAGLKE
jgi:ketosteroid isomerase-like protein